MTDLAVAFSVLANTTVTIDSEINSGDEVEIDLTSTNEVRRTLSLRTALLLTLTS